MESKNEALLKALQDAVDGKPPIDPPAPKPDPEPPKPAEATAPEASSKPSSESEAAIVDNTTAENQQSTTSEPTPNSTEVSEPTVEQEKAVVENNPEPKPEPESAVAPDGDKETASAEKATAEIDPEVKPETALAQEEPAEPETVPAKEKEESAVKSVIKICVPLAVICVVVSLMLSLINFVTAARIEENAAKERAEAIALLYPKMIDFELYETRDGAKIYSVRDDTTLLGACVTVTSNGFGGAIEMMVGINTDDTIKGVRILSMSETPGIGRKTNSEDFLSRYAGKYGPFVLGQNIDGITGASISSKAVTAGVNAVIDLKIDFSKMASKYGVAVGALPSRQTETSESADILRNTETKAPETTAPVAKTVPAETETQLSVEPEPAEITVAVVRTIPELAASGKEVIGSSRITRTEGETVFEKETEPPEETQEPPVDPDLPEPEETTAPPAENTSPEPPADAPETPEAGE